MLRSKRTIAIISLGVSDVLGALFPDKFMGLGDTVKSLFAIIGGVS